MASKKIAAVVAPTIGQNVFARCLPSRGGASVVAHDLGVSRQRVHEWQTGRKQPNLDARLRIEAKIGIPTVTWDQPLNASAVEARAPDPIIVQVTGEARGPAPIVVNMPEAPEPLPATPTDGLARTNSGDVIEQTLNRARLTDLLLDVQRSRRSATGVERQKLTSLEAGLIKQLIAAEEKELVRQTDLFTSALFHDWVTRTVDTLAPWPDAIDALEKMWGLA